MLYAVRELCFYLKSRGMAVKATFPVYTGDQPVQLTLSGVVDLVESLSTGCAQTISYLRGVKKVQAVIDQESAVGVELLEEVALLRNGMSKVSATMPPDTCRG